MELAKYIQTALTAVQQGGTVLGASGQQVLAVDFDISVVPDQTGRLNVDHTSTTAASTLRLRFRIQVQSPPST